ncbi:hypothetical protein [Streptomyces sp. YIM 130001]|nr:hypothetical protein [Streptomyces sp. YIM 130001]
MTTAAGTDEAGEQGSWGADAVNAAVMRTVAATSAGTAAAVAD